MDTHYLYDYKELWDVYFQNKKQGKLWENLLQAVNTDEFEKKFQEFKSCLSEIIGESPNTECNIFIREVAIRIALLGIYNLSQHFVNGILSKIKPLYPESWISFSCCFISAIFLSQYESSHQSLLISIIEELAKLLKSIIKKKTSIQSDVVQELKDMLKISQKYFDQISPDTLSDFPDLKKLKVSEPISPNEPIHNRPNHFNSQFANMNAYPVQNSTQNSHLPSSDNSMNHSAQAVKESHQQNPVMFQYSFYSMPNYAELWKNLFQGGELQQKWLKVIQTDIKSKNFDTVFNDFKLTVENSLKLEDRKCFHFMKEIIPDAVTTRNEDFVTKFVDEILFPFKRACVRYWISLLAKTLSAILDSGSVLPQFAKIPTHLVENLMPTLVESLFGEIFISAFMDVLNALDKGEMHFGKTESDSCSKYYMCYAICLYVCQKSEECLDLQIIDYYIQLSHTFHNRSDVDLFLNLITQEKQSYMPALMPALLDSDLIPDLDVDNSRIQSYGMSDLGVQPRDDNDDWTDVVRSRTKADSISKVVQRPDRIPLPALQWCEKSNIPVGSSAKNKISQFAIDKGRLTIWINHIPLQSPPFSKLQELLKRNVVEHIDTTLMKMLFHLYKEKRVRNPSQLQVNNPKNLENILIKESKIELKGKPYIEDDLVNAFCKLFQSHLKLVSLHVYYDNVNFIGDNNPSSDVTLVHIIGETFLLLCKKSENTEDNSYRQFLSNQIVSYLTEAHKFNQDQNSSSDEKKIVTSLSDLRELQEKLSDFQSSDSDPKVYKEEKSKFTSYVWNPEAPKLLKKKPSKYKECILHNEDAHSAFAVPIGESTTKHATKIPLIGRKNCGRAFDGDRVIVKIFTRKIKDQVEITGCVIYIMESYVKPINQLFLCKMSQDQTNLMRPICRTFPKIHTSNDVARGYYRENGMRAAAQENRNRIRAGLASDRDRAKTRQNYADKLFITTYSVGIDPASRTVEPIEGRVQKVCRYRCNDLFIVLYKNWDPRYLYPFGYVVGQVSLPSRLENYLPLVQTMCRVPQGSPDRFDPDVQRIIQRQSHQSSAQRVDNGVTDMREKYTVTIDGALTKDMDDAISIEEMSHNRGYTIGVHITDVAEWLPEGSPIDLDAAARGFTFYPPSSVSRQVSPCHMLPEKLADQVFSLRPKVDRQCLSVLFTFDRAGALLKDEIRFCSSIIRSDKKLDKESLMNVVSSTGGEKLKKHLRILFYLANGLRLIRLGMEAFVLNDYEDYFEASAVVEEFMVLANESVAKFLTQKFSSSGVLYCCQEAPNPEAIGEFYQKYCLLSKYSGRFSRLMPSLRTRFQLPDLTHNNCALEISFSDAQYKRLKRILKEEPDWREVQQCLLYEKAYPALAVVNREWIDLSALSQYKPAVTSDTSTEHFSLNLQHYVHFTSPIRRYSDIIIHRLLKAALRGDTEAPYSTDYLSETGRELSRMSAVSKRYERCMRSVALALEVGGSSEPVQCVVHQANNKFIELSCIDRLGGEPITEVLKIDMADLGVFESPECKDDGSVGLVFHERLFNLKFRKDSELCEHKLSLSNRLLEYKINETTLRDTLAEMRKRNQLNQSLDSREKLQITKDTVMTLSRKLSTQLKPVFSREFESSIATGIREFIRRDVAWELSHCRQSNSNLVKFHFEVKPGVVIQAFLSNFGDHSWPKISVQRLQLSPSFNICLQHKREDLSSFCPQAKMDAVEELPDRYRDLDDYKKRLLTLIELESVTESVQEYSSFTLHGVEIDWSMHQPTGDIYGLALLNEADFELRQIKLGDDSYHFHHSEYLHRIRNPAWYDIHFICVHTVDDFPASKAWGCHGRIVDAASIRHSSEENEEKANESSATKDKARRSDDKNPSMSDKGEDGLNPDSSIKDRIRKTGRFYGVLFKQSEGSLPPEPSQSFGKRFSIEIIHRTISTRRQMSVVKSLRDRDFACKIALNRRLKEKIVPDKDVILNKVKNDLTKKLNMPEPNREQIFSCEKALKFPLSLIWGPPGTGKTWTGCILSYMFYLINEKTRCEKRQILYCGPSNACVDVVARAMKEKFKDLCPQILRVYGEQIEQTDFPVPSEFEYFSRSDATVYVPEDLKLNSLHHRIRDEKNQCSQHIKKFDALFERYKNKSLLHDDPEINKELLRYYHLTVNRGKADELKKCDMVLCTASASGSPLIQNFCNFYQIIVDEAGMCKEGETLIPLAGGAAKNCESAVLIGDHKQLRPIIQNTLAQQLGMDVSLFERYTRLRQDIITMLVNQYRMHPSICEFPSKHFYENRLITKPSVTWTGVEDDLVKHLENWTGLNESELKVTPEKRRLIKTSMQVNHVNVVTREWKGWRTAPFLCTPNVELPSNSSVPERIVFIHADGKEETQTVSTTEGNENTKSNLVEAQEAVRVYYRLCDRFTLPNNVGNTKANKYNFASKHITILSQYRRQVSLIFEMLKKGEPSLGIPPIVNPKVSTVIRSQGSQNHYVIFSTVRSQAAENINPNPTPGWERQYLGFITDKNQVNVALTRAQKGLIIIGNKELLRVNAMWKVLIEDLEERGCMIQLLQSFLET